MYKNKVILWLKLKEKIIIQQDGHIIQVKIKNKVLAILKVIFKDHWLSKEIKDNLTIVQVLKILCLVWKLKVVYKRII